MNISDEIEWICTNEEKMLTRFDMIFLDLMIKNKSLENENFRKYYDSEMINLNEDSLTDNQSRVGLLERVRSNIVRNLYGSNNKIEFEASMLAYIHHIIQLLNDKHQKIISAILAPLEIRPDLPNNYREYLHHELVRRKSPLLLVPLLVELETPEIISDAAISEIKIHLVGTSSFEQQNFTEINYVYSTRKSR